jgi:hypothetical protein
LFSGANEARPSDFILDPPDFDQFLFAEIRRQRSPRTMAITVPAGYRDGAVWGSAAEEDARLQLAAYSGACE